MALLFFVIMPLRYGLIGYPLTHSFSPAYFQKKFADEGVDAVYDLYPLNDINEVAALLRNVKELRGLNVTIPYKEKVMPFLDEVDAVAATVGAVNCIDIHDGKTRGYNTDVIGFRESLQPLLLPHHTHALILGTGGASKAVKYVLGQMGIAYKMVSRNKEEGQLTYKDITEDTIAEYTLIINTTPLGMSPEIDALPPLPYNVLTPHHLLYDLIYNPAETQFLAQGKRHGAITQNGLEMLQLQADAAWGIWNYSPTV